MILGLQNTQCLQSRYPSPNITLKEPVQAPINKRLLESRYDYYYRDKGGSGLMLGSAGHAGSRCCNGNGRCVLMVVALIPDPYCCFFFFFFTFFLEKT